MASTTVEMATTTITARDNEGEHPVAGRVRAKMIEPIFLAEGSFGRITYFPHQVNVYKTVLRADKESAEKLVAEFSIQSDLADFIKEIWEQDYWGVPRSETFDTPVPHHYYLPDEASIPSSNGLVYPDPSDVFERATTSMDMIPAIHPMYASIFQNLFFSDQVLARTNLAPIRLLRLYFGRSLPEKINELQPGLRSDFALDVSRYRRFKDACGPVLYHKQAVASAMGMILAELHYGIGVDGMDCELVLGGDGRDGLKLWILDFNQCTRWLTHGRPYGPYEETCGDFAKGDMISGARRLARRIAHCEQYYPKPHQDLYKDFRQGYKMGLDRFHYLSQLYSDDDRVERYEAACDAFLTEYERLDGEAQERKARLAKPPTRAEMEARAAASTSASHEER